MKVDLIRASTEEKSIVQNLYPLYLHDLSEFIDDIDINEKGLFNIRFLDLFWQNDSLFAFLIRVDNKLAGFTLLSTPPYTSMEVDYLVNEFFVLKKYRRRGVGRLAAFELLNKFQGRWEIYESPTNKLAQVFWRKIIREYTLGQYESLDDGTKQRFNNAVVMH